jgi:hypothetical protein
VALTDEPPVPPERHRHRATPERPHGPFSPDDDLVEIAHLGATEADLVAGRLHAGGIPAMVVGISPLTGEGGAALRFAEGGRVLVRRADVEAARAELGSGEVVPMSDEELASAAEAADGSDHGDGAVV